MLFWSHVALMLIFGLLGFFTPLKAAPLNDELPSLHYIFAHKYLPNSLFAEPQLGLALAFSEDKQELLLGIWSHLQGKCA